MHTQIRMRIVIRILTLVQSGETPLQVAERKGHASIATLIRNAGSLNLASASSANAAAASAAAAAAEAKRMEQERKRKESEEKAFSIRFVTVLNKTFSN